MIRVASSIGAPLDMDDSRPYTLNRASRPSSGNASTPPRPHPQPQYLAHSPSYQSDPISSFPCASTSSSSAQRTSVSGPSRSYAFPPCSSTDSTMPLGGTSSRSIRRVSPPESTSSISPTGRVAHGLSISERPRRQSSLLHEIQPPGRRLSSHQMLLLTPFGGVIPPGALRSDSPVAETSNATGTSMARGSSSMGRTSSEMSTARGLSRPGSSSMGKETRENRTDSVPPSSSQSRPYGNRIRHHSLATSTVGPSPLASAPMTTIPSRSENGSSSGPGSCAPSREPSEQDRDRLPSLIGGTPGTVPMTRSNSLPIMTIREMQALREKDGELGIARGSGWAWVSHQEEGEDIDDDPIFGRPAATSSNTSYSPATSITPLGTRSNLPFTAFKDPFASSGASSSAPPTGMSRDGTVVNANSSYTPNATLPGYHYSPTYNDTRRMSEAPHHPFTSPSTTTARRPSAPVESMGSSRTPIIDLSNTPPLSSTIAFSSSSSSPRALSTRTIGRGSLGRGSITSTLSGSSASSQRPRITRYKSLPGRHEGLGLQIVLRPSGGSVSSATSSNAAASAREGPGSETFNAGGQASEDAGRRSSIRPRKSGTWAPIDVVDLNLLAVTQAPVHSPIPLVPAHRASAPNVKFVETFSPIKAVEQFDRTFMVEEITSRADLAEFGGVADGKTRPRFDSFDPNVSLTANMSGYVAQLAQSGWNATFPRRGSLAVLTRTPLGPWAEASELGGLGVGDKDRVISSGAHWSERRGSWAEGWTNSGLA